MKLGCCSLKYYIDSFKANFKRYQISNELIICAGYYQKHIGMRISDQLCENNINNRFITDNNGLGILRGNNNLVLLVVELGSNLRLNDSSYDGGYINELRGAQKLAGDQKVLILVIHELKYTFNSYKKSDKFEYIDVIDEYSKPSNNLLSEENIKFIKMYSSKHIL